MPVNIISNKHIEFRLTWWGFLKTNPGLIVMLTYVWLLPFSKATPLGMIAMGLYLVALVVFSYLTVKAWKKYPLMLFQTNALTINASQAIRLEIPWSEVKRISSFRDHHYGSHPKYHDYIHIYFHHPDQYQSKLKNLPPSPFPLKFDTRAEGDPLVVFCKSFHIRPEDMADSLEQFVSHS